MRYSIQRSYFNKRFGLALSARDLAALKKLSAETGESQAVILRQLIRAEAQRRGLLPASRAHAGQGDPHPTATEVDHGRNP